MKNNIIILSIPINLHQIYSRPDYPLLLNYQLMPQLVLKEKYGPFWHKLL
jgi:hypothetical protein